MLSIGIFLFTGGAVGLPALPRGYALLVDADGSVLLDADGCFLLEAI